VIKENVMSAKLSADVIRLVDGRNFAHLATLLADGSPHSAPVWIGREGDHLFIATEDSSVKSRNAQRDPRVAISLVDLDDPYSEAQIRGRVIERRSDSDFKYTDVVSKKYVGKPWPYREQVPVALIIEADHVHYSKQPFEHEKAA
jgi:PPOX class probable F420-dependent enzyme